MVLKTSESVGLASSQGLLCLHLGQMESTELGISGRLRGRGQVDGLSIILVTQEDGSQQMKFGDGILL